MKTFFFLGQEIKDTFYQQLKHLIIVLHQKSPVLVNRNCYSLECYCIFLSKTNPGENKVMRLRNFVSSSIITQLIPLDYPLF